MFMCLKFAIKRMFDVYSKKMCSMYSEKCSKIVFRKNIDHVFNKYSMCIIKKYGCIKNIQCVLKKVDMCEKKEK